MQDRQKFAETFALGLKPRMAGYSGISGWKAVTPEMNVILDGLPELASKYQIGRAHV